MLRLFDPKSSAVHGIKESVNEAAKGSPVTDSTNHPGQTARRIDQPSAAGTNS